MSVIETTCPECKAPTTAWAGGRLIHKTEWDFERACTKHKEKYRKLYMEWLLLRPPVGARRGGI